MKVLICNGECVIISQDTLFYTYFVTVIIFFNCNSKTGYIYIIVFYDSGISIISKCRFKSGKCMFISAFVFVFPSI